MFLGPVYPDAETLRVEDGYTEEELHKLRMAQKRMSAYRSIIFWSYPHIRRGERQPLPSCIYLYVRAMFQAEDDDEAWADHQHSVYASEPN